MAEKGGSAVRGEEAARARYDWAQAYKRWQGWEDNEDSMKRREEDASRIRQMRENNMTCNHDHLQERKVMEMPIEEKLEACREFRRKGNLFHEEGQYRRAALQYRQALIYYDFCFPDEDRVQQELDDIRQACLLNSGACFLRCRELDKTLDCCYEVLQAEPDNVKALYRRAVVYRLKDQFREAALDLGKALAQRPNDVTLLKESAVLKSKINSYKESRKIMSQQIFGAPRAASHKELAPSAYEHEKALRCSGQTDMDRALESVDQRNMTEGTSGGYNVKDVVMAECDGISDDKEQGRRRHDLCLPVFAGLLELEKITGCGWPAN